MPARKDHDQEFGEFKVVDRRPFTSEGDRRQELPAEPPTSPAPEPPPSSSPSDTNAASEPAPTGPESAPAAGPVGPHGPVQFEHLIMSLVSSAMYHLGMATRPGEISRPPDLPAARETIDLLGLLREKTQGNLTREEEQLLSGSLQELRLVYVEITRQAGRVP